MPIDVDHPYYVYFIRASGFVKIGVAKNPSKRLCEIQVGNPHELSLVGSLPCASNKHARKLERFLHRSFRAHRVRGEWFLYEQTIEASKRISVRLLKADAFEAARG